MPAITRTAIEDMFTYHAPDDEQQKVYEKIRAKACELGILIIENTPTSADQIAAIRLLRQTVATANQAVATEGKY